MSPSVPPVDRDDEVRRFELMIGKARPERVFALRAGPGKGKSYLMDIIERRCAGCEVISARVDFRDTLFDSVDLAIFLYRNLSAATTTVLGSSDSLLTAFSDFSRLLKAHQRSWRDPTPPCDSQLDIRTTLIKGNVAAHDYIEHDATVSYNYLFQLNEYYYVELERALGEAFSLGLQQFCSRHTVALLFDTYEQVDSAAKRLVQRILTNLHRSWPDNLVVCVFGQAIPDFTGWGSLVYGQEGLPPFTYEAHAALAQEMNLRLQETALRKYYRELRGEPAATGWFLAILAAGEAPA